MFLVQNMLGFFPFFRWQTDGCSRIYEQVYLPQMCNINTEAMNRRLITNTGTGPTLSPGESSVLNRHIPPVPTEVVQPVHFVPQLAFFLCQTVLCFAERVPWGTHVSATVGQARHVEDGRVVGNWSELQRSPCGFFFLTLFLCICLIVLGLSCGIWNLQLRHVGIF